MIAIYCDNTMVHDSRLENCELLGLTITTALNKGGTAEIIMPPGHPAYNYFVAYRTIVRIYRDNVLQFRGRALYAETDYENNLTITCEGELCLFQDTICRPYLFQTDPETVFDSLIRNHNEQADSFKEFVAGIVTVTDLNDYIRLECESAETTLDVLNKLQEKCGGYFVFSTNDDGDRVINWYAEVGNENNQTIDFGENLLDFTRSSNNTTLATGIIPYGAKDEETGERVDITSVNDGVDYLIDEDSQAVRGTIMVAVYWDDVTIPANLLTKAKAYLEEHRYLVTALELTALDLSYIDKRLDSFKAGDLIRVKSAPHGVDEYFQLTEMTEDLLDPSQSKIALGKNVGSLTSASVAGETSSKTSLQQVTVTYSAETSAAINAAITASENKLMALIAEKPGSIELSVSGSLGGKAAITLTVDDEKTTNTIDLSGVRKAFANDSTTVAISAGTITFESGTLAINSNYFKVSSNGDITATSGTIGALNLCETGIYSNNEDVSGSYAGWYRPDVITADTICIFAGATSQAGTGADFSVTYGGKLTATGAEINGTLTTESGVYKAQLHSGGVGLYYDGELCGTVNTKYWSGASVPGISLRIEEAGQYIMFSHPSDAASGYDVDYYLNYGWSTNYDEKHIFQTSARFLDKVYLSNAYASGLYLYENVYIKACDDDGTATEEMLGYNGERVNVGSVGCPTMLRGTAVYLNNTSTTVTSDRNKKNSIASLPETYEAFLDGLEPVRFKYNEGTSDRYHVGYIAQDVKAALEAAGLSTQDFAGYVDLGGGVGLGLAYDEFVALLHLKIKRLEQRLMALTGAE